MPGVRNSAMITATLIQHTAALTADVLSSALTYRVSVGFSAGGCLGLSLGLALGGPVLRGFGPSAATPHAPAGPRQQQPAAAGASALRGDSRADWSGLRQVPEYCSAYRLYVTGGDAVCVCTVAVGRQLTLGRW